MDEIGSLDHTLQCSAPVQDQALELICQSDHRCRLDTQKKAKPKSSLVTYAAALPAVRSLSLPAWLVSLKTPWLLHCYTLLGELHLEFTMQ